jgi:Putative transposase
MSDQQSQLQRLIIERPGVLPNFVCAAASAPGLIGRLRDFAKSSCVDSPRPSLFKERLFVHLFRFCEIHYCIVRHVGFLIGHGHPAGDPNCASKTIDQAVALLRRPVPGEKAFTDAAARPRFLGYVGRYTHRVAISNNRLMSIGDRQGPISLEGLPGTGRKL